ncbi:flagella synthesis protein FlgN [Nitrosovibrio sp. Nv17]|uniref:flagella synthesis protein FlgN n=1 Tax=Nitrosovibrio sp. Nv17 TaxID=1855339 RepID=UPI000908CBA9|nr:flagellar protein FlgN [Nitrosovibrio sp. Nv17]SFW14759.1 flagella synthesis protein FlgN [Nitrosovibrio sp. Nv17]
MHHTPPAGFDPAAGIARERDAMLDFIDLLRREQHALQQADPSPLPPLATEKAHRAQQLAELAAARAHWLDASGLPHAPGGTGALLREGPATGAWNELRTLAETASQLNRINGILVGQRLRHTQQRLSLLQAIHGAPGTDLYGSGGRPQPCASSRRLGEG